MIRKFTTSFVLFVFVLIGVSQDVFAQTGDPVIVGAGDISPNSNGPQFQTATLVKSLNPQIVLTFGDNQYPDGTLSSFNQYYHPSWGQFKSITRPSPGNHDYHTSGASGYFDYFNGVGNTTGLAGDRTKGYYSFNVGSWHLISLNSEKMSSTQNAWLEADLQANQNTNCTIAYWHKPRFSSSSNHGSDPLTAPFWTHLYNYKADLVLTGHDHTYERFAPQSPTAVSEPTRGLRQYVVGTGGAGLYAFGTPVANSQVRIATHGVLKLTLHANSYDWQFINLNSQVLDSGTGNCVPNGGTVNTSTPTPRFTTTPTPRPNTPTPTGSQRIPGDANGDGRVDIIDFQLLSNTFGKASGQSGYNGNADFNGDNRVDILDFQILSNNFGR